uniref:CCHC-type domain-containing protein n=1 Tax=Rhizophagus irregularis (strain DAOM 181602 / DAOM 197198 / MUCL 43194) TaxID=747089 RepID=U9STL6_RHIID
MMMELSKSVSELKNEIKEKVGNRSHYNGSNNNSQWNRNNNNSDSNGSSNNSYNPTGGNRLPIVCYACGKPGHISRTCPQRNNNKSGVAATVLNQQSQQPQPAQFSTAIVGPKRCTNISIISKFLLLLTLNNIVLSYLSIIIQFPASLVSLSQLVKVHLVHIFDKKVQIELFVAKLFCTQIKQMSKEPLNTHDGRLYSHKIATTIYLFPCKVVGSSPTISIPI